MCNICTTPTMKLIDGQVLHVEEPDMFHYTELHPKLHKFVEFTFNSAYTTEGIANQKIAAMILYKNRPISIGFNSSKTHPLQARFAKNENAIHIHAEIDAIRKASNFLTKAEFTKSTMIVMRAMKTKNWGLARPCIHPNKQGCQSAIQEYGIRKVIYSTSQKGMVQIL